VTNSLKKYLRVGDAAAYLGISPNTLRNWSRAGRIKTHRNPINGYRLFKKADLETLLLRIKSSVRGRD
jgi:excisionase family DNA binding protein